jgi:hypothetical protein
MPLPKRVKAFRNAMKMRARGYRNSGNKTPNGLIIWVKTVNGVTKRKTANGTPVNNGRTTNNNNSSVNVPMYFVTNSYGQNYGALTGPMGNRIGSSAGYN